MQMTATEQRDAARVVANERRTELAALKRGLRNGSVSLEAVLSDPPDELRGRLLIDVIRWTRSKSNGRAITEVGRQALRDNVNLMVAVGDTSARTRAWVAQWGGYWWRPGL